MPLSTVWLADALSVHVAHFGQASLAASGVAQYWSLSASPDDLKRGVRLAGVSGHDPQVALLTTSDGIDGQGRR